MQNSRVPDRNAVSDYGGVAMIGMDHGAILNICFIPNANRLYIAPQHGRGPDAGVLPDRYVADNVRAGIDVGGRGYLGCDAAVGTDHGCSNALEDVLNRGRPIGVERFDDLQPP